MQTCYSINYKDHYLEADQNTIFNVSPLFLHSSENTLICIQVTGLDNGHILCLDAARERTLQGIRLHEAQYLWLEVFIQ